MSIGIVFYDKCESATNIHPLEPILNIGNEAQNQSIVDIMTKTLKDNESQTNG